jgi:hypothetical protein
MARAQPPRIDGVASCERPSAAQRADTILREQYAALKRRARTLEEEVLTLRAAAQPRLVDADHK